MKAEKLFVILNDEKERYNKEVDSSLFHLRSLHFIEELNKAARDEITFYEGMMDNKDNLSQKFFEATKSYRNVNFSGKLIIRPYETLIAAIRDGIMGVYDSGMVAASMMGEGYLFAIRLPGVEDKAFGYVLYDTDGNILKARQAFGLNIQNEAILKYLRLFSRDILLPALKKQKTA